MNLLNHARVLKTVGYRAVYAIGGKVFVKRSELSKPKFIANEEEVDMFLLEATTNKNRGRRSQHETAGAYGNNGGDDDVYLSS